MALTHLPSNGGEVRGYVEDAVWLSPPDCSTGEGQEGSV